MGELDDKVVVVTGASRGLGAAMAVGFAQAGAHVVLAARNVDDLGLVAARCTSVGRVEPLVVPTDVGDPVAAEALVSQTLEVHGSLDVFVANAGAAPTSLGDERPGTLTEFSYELADALVRVNTLGMFLSMRTALPVMTQGASFIAIGSELGPMVVPSMGMYGVSKGAVDQLVALAAAEVAGRGVRVNELSPGGMVDTNLFGPDGMPERIKAHVPWSEPDVIVPAAVWLASDDSLGVNGAHVVAKEFNARGAAATKAALLAEA